MFERPIRVEPWPRRVNTSDNQPMARRGSGIDIYMASWVWITHGVATSTREISKEIHQETHQETFLQFPTYMKHIQRWDSKRVPQKCIPPNIEYPPIEMMVLKYLILDSLLFNPIHQGTKGKSW